MSDKQDLLHAIKALEAAARAIEVAAQKIAKVVQKPDLKVVDNSSKSDS